MGIVWHDTGYGCAHCRFVGCGVQWLTLPDAGFGSSRRNEFIISLPDFSVPRRGPWSLRPVRTLPHPRPLSLQTSLQYCGPDSWVAHFWYNVPVTKLTPPYTPPPWSPLLSDRGLKEMRLYTSFVDSVHERSRAGQRTPLGLSHILSIKPQQRKHCLTQRWSWLKQA